MFRKRGALGDNVSFIAFLFLMIIVGVGIVAGVFIFYGKGYDAKNVEAELLNYKIRECMMENELKNGFFEDFFKKCRLDKSIIEEFNIIKICSGEGGWVEKEILRDDVLFYSGSNFQLCLMENSIMECSISNLNIDGIRYEIVTGSKQESRRQE